MEKKILVVLMALTAAVCCAFGFAACKDNSGNDAAVDPAWGEVYTVKAAYSLATDLGYAGTLEQFIQQISGKDGTDGVGISDTIVNSDGELVIVLSNGTTKNLGKLTGSDGADGADGENGLSAFEIYIKYHPEYSGTEQEWIESLKGADGINGNNGIGVKNSYINADGELIIVLTNDNELNCGNISAHYEQLQYASIKENNEIIGYSVVGLGTVSDTDLVIPSTYRGKPVTAIGERGLYQCRFIKKVTIPATVTSIERNSFEQCHSLTELNYLGSLEDWCKISIEFPCWNIEKFYINNELVTDLIIPDTVTEIKDYAFYGLSSLTSVTFGNNLETIGDCAFNSCSGLEGFSFIIPKSVTSIGAAAFVNGVDSAKIFYLRTYAEIQELDVELHTGGMWYFYSETEPTEGNRLGWYWHYVDGEIEIWNYSE